MDEKRNEQAMKLYEAMSGVDPELLARSEKAGKKNKVIPFYRYARAMAACIALIVVGSACWAVLHNGGLKSATSEAPKTAMNGIVSDSAGNSMKSEATRPAVVEENAVDANAEAPAADSYEDREKMEECEGEPDMACETREYSATSEAQSLSHDAIDNLRGKLNMQTNSDGWFADKWMEVSLNQDEPVKVNIETWARILYDYLNGLDVILVEDAPEFTDYLTVLVYEQGKDEASEAFCISGDYMKLMGVEETYLIQDDEYDYYELVDFIRQIVDGEN